jgi:hypothetical protein
VRRPPFVGRAGLILRGLQLSIVSLGLGCGLIERDMRAAGDGAPGQPTQVDGNRWPAGLGLYRREEA